MSNLKIKFGEKLRELRKNKRYSQEFFAELININPRNLSKIETGQSFPSVENLENMAKVLECNLFELFKFEKPSSKRAKLLFAIEHMSEDEISVLYKLLKSIK